MNKCYIFPRNLVGYSLSSVTDAISSGRTLTALGQRQNPSLKKKELHFFLFFLNAFYENTSMYIHCIHFILHFVLTCNGAFTVLYNLVVNKGMRCATVDRFCPKYVFAPGFSVLVLRPYSVPPLWLNSDSFREHTVIMWTSDIM